MSAPDEEMRFCVLIVKLRREGASLRVIAKMFGISKSTLHRQLSAIEFIAAEVSQMGQNPQPNDQTARHCSTELSQMGQEEEAAA